jgi:hypothetical protein
MEGHTVMKTDARHTKNARKYAEHERVLHDYTFAWLWFGLANGRALLNFGKAEFKNFG